MSTIFTIVTTLALILGAVHGIYVYRKQASTRPQTLVRQPFAARLQAAYYALWTLLLWALLGATVVLHWAIAVVPYLITKAVRRGGSNPLVR